MNNNIKKRIKTIIIAIHSFAWRIKDVYKHVYIKEKVHIKCILTFWFYIK